MGKKSKESFRGPKTGCQSSTDWVTYVAQDTMVYFLLSTSRIASYSPTPFPSCSPPMLPKTSSKEFPSPQDRFLRSMCSCRKEGVIKRFHQKHRCPEEGCYCILATVCCLGGHYKPVQPQMDPTQMGEI